MSTGCSHHSTQITLRVQSQTLWLRYSSTRWDTLVLDYKTTGITREIQSSEKPTMLQERAEPPGRGGDRATYRSYLGEYLSSVARLMDGNACTAAHPELDEVFDYLQRLMPED